VASLKLAQDDLKFPVYDNVRSKLQKDLDKDLNEWIESPELKTAIGRAAKDSGWFKDITRGDKWFATISLAFADPDFSKKDTAVKLASLWTWASDV
jgi:putative ATP-dependent endonuclease of OLD family